MRKSLNRIASIATSVAMVGTMLLSAGPAHAAPVTLISDTLSREKVSTLATHSLKFTTAGAETGNIDILYTSFTGMAFIGGTCAGGGSIADNGTAVDTLHVTQSCGAGLVTINFSATNPALAGGYAMTFGPAYTGTGTFSVPITLDDQIIVTAVVAPTMTFQVTTDHSGLNRVCSHGTDGISTDHTPDTDGGVVELGVLSPLQLTSSDKVRVGSSGQDGWVDPLVSGTNTYQAGTVVQHICTFVSTSSAHGYGITVVSANGGLANTDLSSYINSNSGPGSEGPDTTPAAAVLVPGQEAYAMCLSTSDGPDQDSTNPAGSLLIGTGNFAPATCNASSTAAGELTATTQPIGGETTGPVQEGTADWLIKSTIKATTLAGQYTDVLTFIATSTF